MKTNTKATSKSKTRLAGGFGPKAAKQSEIAKLKRLTMACLLWEDIAYAKGSTVAAEISATVPNCSPEECRDLAIAIRKDQKLRHVPLLVIREMAKLPEHRKYVSETLASVCTRPDQMTEFLSLYWRDNGRKTLSNQVKDGLASAFNNFDEYQLAKYARSTEVKLRDVLRLVHPKPRDEAQSSLWKRLNEGTLQTPDTWEVGLSAAKSDKEKAEVWTRLIDGKKLGSLALLRNLRNMQAVLPKATVRKAIASANPAMLLPIDFIKAVDYAPDYVSELESLMFSCLGQYQKLKGETIFILDVSGSMGSSLSSKSGYTRMDAGIAMTILAREMCEHCTIYLTAGYDGLRRHKTEKIPSYRGFGLAKHIKEQVPKLGGGGIFTRQCLEHIKTKEEIPERIIVFSDSADCDFADKREPNPFGRKNYIVDVSSHSCGVNYAGKWTAEISGWSEHFLKFISAIEENV